MTTQQATYMRYQQMRQNAMRAFVAQAAGAAKEEPVPPPPPAKRQVVLSTVKTDGVTQVPAPEITVTECDPTTWEPKEGKQATGTGTVSYEADSTSGIQPGVPVGFENDGYVYEFTGFTVNGQPVQASGGRPSPAYWTNIVPGTGVLDVKASYSETPAMKHVSLLAIETGTNNPLDATVWIQEYSGRDPEVLIDEVQATHTVSADIHPGNWIRIRTNEMFENRGF